MAEKTGFLQRLYLRKAEKLDKQIGGISVGERKRSRFSSQGAEAVQSSDYRCLDRLFRGRHFSRDDVLLDVGCGEGRVLTRLLQKGFPGRLIGIELDPDAAETARSRTAGCPNTEVLCGSILDATEQVRAATMFYLFNPFNGKIFCKFVAMLEKECTRPVTMFYLFDYYAGYLDGRPGWSRQRDMTVKRPGQDDAHASIWYFSPQKSE